MEHIPALVVGVFAGTVCMSSGYVCARALFVLHYRLKILNDERLSLNWRLGLLKALPSFEWMVLQLFTWEW